MNLTPIKTFWNERIYNLHQMLTYVRNGFFHLYLLKGQLQ